MYSLAIILIIITSILLILIVLVQNSKGGGLSSTFAAGNQFGGVAQTNKFLEKATWTLAVALLVFSLLASLSIPRMSDAERESMLKEQINKNVDYNTPPTIPVKPVEQKKGNN